jgi:tetratricopeptide (TPR) repeat protein
MEFADIPQQERASLPPQVAPPRVAVDARKADKAAKKTSTEPKKSRAAVIVAALLVLVLAAGVGLGFTPHGYFGMYFFDQYMPGAGDPGQVRAAITRAEEQAAGDTWSGARESLSTLASARRGAGLNRELLARSLLHESLFQIRFGADARSATRASSIRARLEERGGLEGPELALGLAAHALRTDNVTGARAQLSVARRHAPSDPYVDLLAGEIALARGELAEAEEAFAQAAERGAGARGLWGVVRARERGEDEDAERAAIDAVLRASPTHEEALLARATRMLDEGQIDPALAIAEQVVGRAPLEGQPLRVAPRARAHGWTLIGRVAEARGRGTQALEAYGRALAAHDAHVAALLGAGRVLLEDRPADAIARFDSVLAAEGANETILANGRTAAQEAQLGSARANLALEHVQEAATSLGALSAARADDAEVLLWLGHAERRLDPPNREAAEAHYRAAIAAAPDQFPGYLALAELFFETDRGTDAGTVLQQAATRVPESAEMRLELGRFELRRNRLPAAMTELRRALALDADLPAAHFALGVAYRRAGRLEEADQTFAHLARIDAAHPRLALERGLLFEARGEASRAVESYRAALRENEGDMDLMLRLGAAQVAAGDIDDAEQTLEQVYEARPSSADAVHLVGRVAFARGRYAEALNQFRQATRIDPTRGELHLYVAWAALESNQLGEALQSAEAAIARDPSLGEAYWVRAVVRLRSGNPADALSDLQRALDLRPSFHRIHATMGDTYDQLGRLSDAVASYERAVERVDDEGGWWWRLGRLRMDGNDRRGALVALSRATLLGEAATPLPGWLAASHRLYGDALRLDRQRAEAVTHYRRYLALAPPGDIDRADVRRILMDMGEVPGE